MGVGWHVAWLEAGQKKEEERPTSNAGQRKGTSKTKKNCWQKKRNLPESAKK